MAVVDPRAHVNGRARIACGVTDRKSRAIGINRLLREGVILPGATARLELSRIGARHIDCRLLGVCSLVKLVGELVLED